MKQLISAADIRKAKADKKGYLIVPLAQYIITPEARDVANVEGIELLDKEPSQQSVISQPEVQAGSDTVQNAQTGEVECQQRLAAKIQSEIESKLSGVDSDQSALIKELINKALQDFGVQAPPSARQINDDGIVLVRGSAVQLGEFDGAPGKNIGLTDVIGAQDNSNMGVGYMGWENAFFPWTLCYDEVNVVLEGEFHVKTASGTTIGQPGDVIFIPKGSTVEFGTPTHVRYVYITYPAEWA
ncbi:ethanolamine utilization acetate kinase EutQ [Photobacterium gaetbulicola]|uniref:Ethanolamine utilization protein EutQ n=2 Tax=Photobacterium gaetbulicola TaxID=1295392 RepID=A0A0B9G4M6_9GAMM|nr:ethanolamine utilization acetate kinase EutQ [Photobacterium gaetbulicola]AJR08953.1 putative ethanolamine utilization EutQ family protein [Photobacterium gaetbulicola Gung47]KHT63569.1 ethanolamine utilization protein EutQ [Photobacterium gaetbulicola]PSU13509.1 ethanolamine utilization acetate kinase EutQ [Photobacterium gaetbulicola]